MNKQHFFILGGGSLQVKFIKKVKYSGYIVHVFDYNPECEGGKEADYFHLVSIDDKEEIYKIAQFYNPVAIQTVATEMGNITACYIGEKLGLNNNSFDTALNTTDKSRMKKIFHAYGIKSAKAIELHDDANLSCPPLNFPFVVKASDRSASRGVTFVKNQFEFEVAFKEAMRESCNKIVLVEEYLSGQQFSVETISGNGKHYIVAVTEENTNGIPDFVETHHLMPARIDNDMYDSLKKFIFYTLDAFQIRHGAGHVELKYNNGEWAVIELASRMGGWRDELAELSMGIDYLQLILNSSVGLELKILPKYRRYAIVRTILNNLDWEKYLFFKSEYSQNLFYDYVEYKGIAFQAKTLMQTQGRYYLVSDDPCLIVEFMEN